MKKKLSLIYIFFLLSFLFTMSGKIGVIDAYMSYYTAKNLVEHRKFDIKTGNMEAHSVLYQISKGVDGKYYSVFQPGCLPFIIILIYLSKAFSFLLPITHLRFEELFVSLYSPFICSLIIFVFFKFCMNLGYRFKTCLITSMLLAFASPIWVYSKVNFNEPLQILSMLYSLYLIHLFKTSNSKYENLILFFAGFSMAYAPVTRIIGILSVPGIIFYYILVIYCKYRFDYKKIIIKSFYFFIPGFFLMAALLYYNYFRFGNIFDTGDHYYAKESYDYLKGVYYNFLSPQKGLFLFCPLLVLAMFKFKAFFLKYKIETFGFLMVFLPFFIYIPSIAGFSGSWAYGPRHFLFLIPILFFFIAEYIETLFDKTIYKYLLYVLAVFSIALTFMSMSIDPLSAYRFYYMERDNYKNSFVSEKQHKEAVHYLTYYNVLPDGIWFSNPTFYISNYTDIFLNKSLRIRGLSLKKYHYLNFWFLKIIKNTSAKITIILYVFLFFYFLMLYFIFLKLQKTNEEEERRYCQLSS